MSGENQLYILLREHSGDYLSADQISRTLGADWDYVQLLLDNLQRAGATIECHPVLGYRLDQLPDSLLACEVGYELETRCFGKQVQIYQEVDSTNDEVRQLAEQGAPEGSLVIAEGQRAGRGRRGRNWHSPPGTGLWCSLLAYPHAQTSLGFLTLLFGVAIARAIRLHCGACAVLKWPNDILLGGRKVAGILCELHATAAGPAPLVAGFGINVNQEDFPLELRASATSIYLHTAQKFQRAALLKRLLREIEQDYLCAAAGGEELIMDQARSFSSTLGRFVRVETDERKMGGYAVDLDASGALILADEGGVRRAVHAGDVHHLEEPTSGEISLDVKSPDS
ncbi:MAG: biotin--[acetyl-CoA-carboxylase] ligase [Gemmatimonadetes bacterium]|nr:biotin--[acetyl-CoA-carboxylase] ligase [Gemmatimonadota bacterium]